MTKILNVEDGYNLFSEYYKDEYKYLDSFDWINFIEIFKEIIKEKNGLKILILGCGDGRETIRIIKLLNKMNINFEIFGVDISEKMLEKLWKKLKKFDIKKENFFKFNFLNKFDEKFHNFFDIVIGLFVLVHIKPLYLNDFFSNISNILKTKGFFIFNNIPQKEGKIIKTQNERFIIEFFDHKRENIINLSFLNKFNIIRIDEIKEKGIKISDIFLLEKL